MLERCFNFIVLFPPYIYAFTHIEHIVNLCLFLQGARMVRELFEMARTKKACIIFFDEIDAVGGARFDDGAGGDNEVQRTMLELINQLDGFDPRGNIKVLMATNRPDTLDPALMRPGRLDRKVEFSLPDLEVGLVSLLSLLMAMFGYLALLYFLASQIRVVRTSSRFTPSR